jgi:CBS domain-containing protein
MTFSIYDFGQRILTPLEPKSAIQKLGEIQPTEKSAKAGPYVNPKDPHQSPAEEQQGGLARFKKHAKVFEALADKAQSEYPIFLREIMSTKPITTTPKTSIHTAHLLMTKTGVRHLPVLDAKGSLVGLLSDRDLLKVLLTRRPQGLRVEQVMVSKLLVAEPGTDIRQASQVLKEYHIGCLPILSPEGVLLGIVTRTDLLGVLSAYGPLHIKA